MGVGPCCANAPKSESNIDVSFDWRKSSVDVRSVSVAIDSASFQVHLEPDVKSIEKALHVAERAGPNGLDMTQCHILLNGERQHWSKPMRMWAELKRESFRSISDERFRIWIASLLKVLQRGGFFDRRSAYNAAFSVVASCGAQVQMKLLLKMCPHGEQRLCSIEDTPIPLLGLHQAIWVNQWNFGPNDIACQIVDLATDDYLSTNFCVKRNGVFRAASFLSIAVRKRRPYAVSAILKRLPRIPLDTYTGLCSRDRWPSTAESIMASVEITENSSVAAREIKAMLDAADWILNQYHIGVALSIESTLKPLLLPEIISIVQDFAARIPAQLSMLLQNPA